MIMMITACDDAAMRLSLQLRRDAAVTCPEPSHDDDNNHIRLYHGTWSMVVVLNHGSRSMLQPR